MHKVNFKLFRPPLVERESKCNPAQLLRDEWKGLNILLSDFLL